MYVIGNFLIGVFLFFSPPSTNEPQVQPPASNPSTTLDCASDLLLEEYYPAHPLLQQQLEKQDQAYRDYAQQDQKILAEYTLPVVVHIVHNYGDEDISDAQAVQAVQDLNDAFANVGYYDQNTGVDTEIEFCLAKRDPDGNSTTGITRTVSTLTVFSLETQDLDLKDLIRWDPTQYINIWVVRDICSISIGCGVAGYAFFPASHGTPEDGIVVEAEYFGSTQPNSSVLVHEMGHYLGLYHTFQDGCVNEDCLADGDQVCDTPPDQTTVAVPCEDVVINSCDTDVNPTDPNNPFTEDQEDLYNNYMDYGDVNCYNMFTQGQTDRMAFFIEGPRASLLDSDACTHPCPDPMTINFTPSDTLVELGTTINFQNLSLGADTYEWRVGGLLEATTEDFTFTFNTVGTFEVELTLMNDNPDCTVTLSINVRVFDCLGNAWVSEVDGNDVSGCGTPGNPCQTIQYALDNVLCPGDTVFIRSGTYTLPVTEPVLTPIASIPEGYGVTFFGVEDNGPVIIDGNNQRRGFQYNYIGNTCPDANPNDGIPADFALNFHNLTLQNCWVVAYDCGSTTFAYGGAIQIYNDEDSELSVHISNCNFRDNFLDDPVFLNNSGRSVSGAAIYINGRANGSLPVNTEVLIEDCLFNNNRCQQQANGGHGGAICLVNCNIGRVRSSLFCENTVFSEMADNGDLQFDRNAGGAILVMDTYNGADEHFYSVDSSYFVNNAATTTDGATFNFNSEGGAIFLTRGDNINGSTTATLLVGNSFFYNNFIETGIEHVDANSGNLNLNLLGPNVFEDDFEVNIANDTTVCDSVFISVLNPIPGAGYEWSDGTVGPEIFITESGEYIVTLRIGGCETSDTIEVTVTPCAEICGNGIDDDGDGLVDCCDPDLENDPCCEGFPFLNLGPDTLLICDNGVVELMADTGFVSYEWQDGWEEPTYTAYEPGTYWVTVEDSICGTRTDTITLITDPETVARVEPGFAQICPGQSVNYSVDPVFETYQWLPGDYLSCDDCPNPVSTPDEPVTYIFIGGLPNGCYSVDTISITFQNFATAETVTVCTGESVEIFGETVSAPGLYSMMFTSVDGCDSTHTVTLANHPATTLNFSVTPSCPSGSDGVVSVQASGTPGPYTYNWDASPDNDSTIENLPPGDYAVTVTDGNNCETEAIVTIPPAEAPIDFLADGPPSCVGECDGNLSIETGGTTGLSYRIDGGPITTDNPITGLCAGQYDLEIIDADGCVYNRTFAIQDPAPLTLNYPQVLAAELGDVITITGVVSNVQGSGVVFDWQPQEDLSCTDCQSPQVTVIGEAAYVVTAVDGNGCTATDTIRIIVDVDCESDENIQIPTIFTPNNDDSNDTWKPLVGSPSISVVRVSVYNRWGQLVFEGIGNDAVWDGRQNEEPAPSDVYGYLIEFQCAGLQVTRAGEVTLVR